MSEDDAEISFTAAVAAEELDFREVPESRVDFTGDPAPGSNSGSARRGVSRPAREGVRYTDVRVDYRIMAALDPQLGERPAQE